MKWPRVRFSELYHEPSRNGLNRPSRVRGAGCKMVNMGELFANDRIGDIPMDRVPMSEREIEQSVLQEGDLLFARQSLVLEGAGKCIYVQCLSEPTTFESHIIRVRLNQLVARSLFYYYLFRSPFSGISTIVQQCAQAGIRGSALADLPVPYPPLPTQHAIAEALCAYDDLIENNRRRMALLEEAARLLYQERFVRLHFPGHEHIRITDGVPAGWERCGVADFGDVITGKTPSTKEPDNYGGDIPFVKIPDMHGSVFVIETAACLTDKGANTQPSKFLPAGSLLVSCIGTLGVVALTSTQSQCNQQINAVVPHQDVYRYYCYHAFKGLKARMDALGGGATMGNVSKGKFETLELPRPAMSLLQLYHDYCVPLFRQVYVLAMANQHLRSARDLLLPRLMSGEIEV